MKTSEVIKVLERDLKSNKTMSTWGNMFTSRANTMIKKRIQALELAIATLRKAKD